MSYPTLSSAARHVDRRYLGRPRSNTLRRRDARQILSATGLAAQDIHARQLPWCIFVLSHHRVHKWPCPRDYSCGQSAISSSSSLPLRSHGPSDGLHTPLRSLVEVSTRACGCPDLYQPRSGESQHRWQRPRLHTPARISQHSLRRGRDTGGEECRPAWNCCLSSNWADSKEKPEEI